MEVNYSIYLDCRFALCNTEVDINRAIYRNPHKGELAIHHLFEGNLATRMFNSQAMAMTFQAKISVLEWNFTFIPKYQVGIETSNHFLTI